MANRKLGNQGNVGNLCFLISEFSILAVEQNCGCYLWMLLVTTNYQLTKCSDLQTNFCFMMPRGPYQD